MKTPDHLKREFVDRRTHAPDDDPPDLEEIQRQLGHRLIEAEREESDQH